MSVTDMEKMIFYNVSRLQIQYLNHDIIKNENLPYNQYSLSINEKAHIGRLRKKIMLDFVSQISKTHKLIIQSTKIILFVNTGKQTPIIPSRYKYHIYDHKVAIIKNKREFFLAPCHFNNDYLLFQFDTYTSSSFQRPPIVQDIVLNDIRRIAGMKYNINEPKYWRIGKHALCTTKVVQRYDNYTMDKKQYTYKECEDMAKTYLYELLYK